MKISPNGNSRIVKKATKRFILVVNIRYLETKITNSDEAYCDSRRTYVVSTLPDISINTNIAQCLGKESVMCSLSALIYLMIAHESRHM